MSMSYHRDHDRRRDRNSSSPSSTSTAGTTRISNPSPNPGTNTDRYAPDWKLRRSNRPQRHEIQEKVNEDDLHHVSSIIGTCSLMCPDGERAQRERLQDLAVFERLNGNRGKTTAELAVKKFCRTISNKHAQASDVRPLPVLEKTLDYLLKLFNSSEDSFEVVHDFIFDRTRSIRQDLSMQNIVSEKAIHMYEEMVKFHVISQHRLRSCSGSSISSIHHLNMEQLLKALNSLFNLYEANRYLNNIYENEPEFRSLYVLLRLDYRSQPMGESNSVWFRHLPLPVMRSKEMLFARKVARFFGLSNYKGFLLTIAAEASFLQYCILEPYINEVRALAVSCVNSVGYKLHPYPISHLSKLLIMKESDMESFCKACGLETSTDEAGNKFLPAKQTTFSSPKGLQSYILFGIERFKRFG